MFSTVGRKRERFFWYTVLFAGLLVACKSDNVPCPSNILCGPSKTCCAEGEECVNDQCITACANERCGPNLTVCCEAGQECIDDTWCMEACANERCGYNQTVCCQAGEECVNDYLCLPVCANQRCGDNLTVCCEADQECLDGVVCAKVCLANETVCGESLDVCCTADEVCINNECIAPGLDCDNNFDCLDDSYYCETSISQCLPVPAGPLCEGEPTFTDIQPVLEWYWPGIEYAGHNYQNIISAPVVGDVNGDGTPDVVVVVYHDSSQTDCIIVVLDGAGDGSGGPQVLLTIPGEDDPDAPHPFWVSSPALANFDSDPGMEIVYTITGNGGVRIADNDGEGTVCDEATYPSCTGLRTEGTCATEPWGGPSIADLDHDGMPDVISRCHAMNGRDISNSDLDFMDVSDCGEDSVIADLNQDGMPEIIDASHAVSADPNNLGGVDFWKDSNDLTSGFVAVADILATNPGPEVVNIRDQIYILDGQTGTILIGSGGTLLNQAITIPGAGRGGAPTVADFDGDGEMEVSTAGNAFYVVYDPDCTDPPLRGGQCNTDRTDFILWTKPTQDLSSSRTGSSVFDFQGDGPAEVLYNDECFLHIFNGTDGSPMVTPLIPNSSRTGPEYPLVADVDGDGNSEIVVISNADQAIGRDNCDLAWKNAEVDIDWLCQMTNCTANGPCQAGGVCPDSSDNYYLCDSSNTCQLPGGTHGVRIYGDANDRWVGTRTIWNQFSYHVTNIELQSGYWTIPTNEEANWLSYNNYRQNVQGGTVFPVPDLRVELDVVGLCPGQVRLAAVLHNEGSLGVLSGVPVTFFRTDSGVANPPEELGTLNTTETILPGGWERLVYIYDVPKTDVEMTFAATTDASESIEECDEDDNTDTSDAISCPGLID